MSEQKDRAFSVEFGDVKIARLGGEPETLRVAFSVERDKLPWPNNVELNVYNLSEKTRARLTEAGPVTARVSAGYKTEPKQLFFGVLDIVEHLKDGTEWVTHMSATDCGEKIKQARVTASFNKGVLVVDVIRAILATLGLGNGNLDAFSSDPDLRRPLPHGGALHGNAVEELAYFLRSANLEFSIQSGKVQFLKIGGGTPNTKGPLLSPTTGLVGSAHLVREKATDLTRPKTKQTAKNSVEGALGEHVDLITTIEGTCLLNGAMAPGVPFEIKSATVNAQAMACAVKHSGDTRGNDWYTDFKAIPLDDAA